LSKVRILAVAITGVSSSISFVGIGWC